MQPWVVIEGDPERREELRRGEIVFGRGVSADVQVVHGLVSRMHATARRLGDGAWVIQDLGSSNGTWVDAQRITRHVLQDGDRVHLGGTDGPGLVFHLPRADEPAGSTSLSRPAAADRGHTAVWSAIQAGPGGTLGAYSGERSTDDDPNRTAFFAGLDLRRRHVQLLVDGFGVQSFEVSVFHPVKVGRDRVLNAVCLPHPSVSVEHAVVRVDDALHPVVEDLESTNGTFVNGERVVRSHALKEGDLITFGTLSSRALMFRDSSREEVQILATQLKDGRLTIGRDPQADLVLNHFLISRHHAELVETAEGFALTDLGSQNGTFVNEERVQHHRVQENDRIRIGPYQLVFREGGLQQNLDGTAVEVSAHDVVVEADTGQGRVPILRGVSVVAGRREIVAIIGASGSGKSTLLGALAGLMPITSGAVLYNGVPLEEVRGRERSFVAYVPQADFLHGELTVEQSLEHAARLRLPAASTALERYEQVQRVVELLELGDRRQTRVAQLSGGQRKRVSIGLELLSQPGVLILDEPTAGLDPRTEERMMHLFRRIAGDGCTLLLTTHLLGSFDLFDRVAVLAEGRMAFFGKPNEFYEYFDVNAPRDVYGRLEGERDPTEWEAAFVASRLHETHVHNRLAETQRTALPDAAPRVRGLGQAMVLASRYGSRKLGDRGGMVVLAAQGPLIGCLSLAVSGGAPNAPRTLFILVIAALWFGCMNAVREVVDEWPLYRRERIVGVAIGPYLLSKVAILLPLGMAQMALLAGVLAAGGGMTGHLLPAIALLTVLYAVGTAIGLLTSCIVRSAASALAAVPLLMIPQILFAGLLVPTGRVTTLVPRTAQEIIDANQEAGESLQRLKEQVGEGLAEGVAVAEVTDPGRKELGRWTAVTEADPLATALSYPMAARWGMEGLAHLYLGDPFTLGATRSEQYYQYQLANSVYFSLYTAAERDAVRQRLLAGRAEGSEGTAAGRGWQYAGILGGFFALLMSAAVMVLRRRDREPLR